MGVEKTLQTNIIKYLKGKKCVVMKLTVVPGIPIGTSDLVFFCEGFYGFIEVKASKTAPFHPLQPEFLKKMNEWSWAKAVYPENWEKIKAELEAIL